MVAVTGGKENLMRMKTIILTLFLLFGMDNIFTPAQSYAISLDDDEEDMEDAEAYLRKAQQKAESESFSEAQKYLKKAKRLGVIRDEVKTTESRIQHAKNDYEERLEREARARAEKERKEKEEAEKQAQLLRKAQELRENSSQSYSSSSYSSSASNPKTVATYVCTTICTGAWGAIRGSKISRVYNFSISDPDSYIVPFEIVRKAENEFKDYCEHTWSFHYNKPGYGAVRGLVSCERKLY